MFYSVASCVLKMEEVSVALDVPSSVFCEKILEEKEKSLLNHCEVTFSASSHRSKSDRGKSLDLLEEESGTHRKYGICSN